MSFEILSLVVGILCSSFPSSSSQVTVDLDHLMKLPDCFSFFVTGEWGELLAPGQEALEDINSPWVLMQERANLVLEPASQLQQHRIIHQHDVRYILLGPRLTLHLSMQP